MKRLVIKVLMCSVLCMSLAGCKDMADETSKESSSQIAVDNKISTEDYVYDYQVSMDPIPKELADLGGSCQGTIHAFPSKIKTALTEQKLEEDPELKSEVEKRKVEVEQYLETEIGKDFSIDGVVVEDFADWYWICTEVDTGYQFALSYSNDQYFNLKVEGRDYGSENDIYIDDYYAKEDTLEYAHEINKMIEEVFPDSFYYVRARDQGEEIYIVEISIIQYMDVVDKCQEQVKILELWDRLRQKDDSDWYLVSWIYCSDEYRVVMEDKYNNGLFVDSLNTSDEDLISTLIEQGDLTEYLRGNLFFDASEEVNLDTLVEDYKNGNYEANKIWPLWVE